MNEHATTTVEGIEIDTPQETNMLEAKETIYDTIGEIIILPLLAAICVLVVWALYTTGFWAVAFDTCWFGIQLAVGLICTVLATAVVWIPLYLVILFVLFLLGIIL